MWGRVLVSAPEARSAEGDEGGIAALVSSAADLYQDTYEIKCTILNRTHMLTNLKINGIIFKTMFQWEGKYEKLFCILISFVLVAGAITSFAGCGPKTPEDNRAVRALDTSFVDAWQGSDGTEYVVSKPEYEQNATAESTDLLTSITPDIQTYEDNLLMFGTWTAVTVDGFEFNATNSNIWQYNVEVPNVSTDETEIYTCTSFILLVRIKATDSTAHSRVHVLEYQLPYEPAE